MADTTCIRCKRSQPNEEELKRCEKCEVAYCSTDCLKADKKKHQRRCGKGNPPPSDPGFGSGSSDPNDRPFTRLDQGKYLHDRARDDVFRLLLDCYRLRVDDDNKFEGITPPASPSDGFRRFLGLAKQRSELLPEWWDDAAAMECMAVGVEHKTRWCNLERPISKGEVNSYYGSPTMAMQLRMLGEVVYQRGVAGQDGTAMRKAMASQERSGNGGVGAFFSLSG
ncbi:hypothetical protein OQA88_5201 [Cercophora sp. LCS_1]